MPYVRTSVVEVLNNRNSIMHSHFEGLPLLKGSQCTLKVTIANFGIREKLKFLLKFMCWNAIPNAHCTSEKIPYEQDSHRIWKSHLLGNNRTMHCCYINRASWIEGVSHSAQFHWKLQRNSWIERNGNEIVLPQISVLSYFWEEPRGQLQFHSCCWKETSSSVLFSWKKYFKTRIISGMKHLQASIADIESMWVAC